jgi:alpha-L-rhamnosidase
MLAMNPAASAARYLCIFTVIASALTLPPAAAEAGLKVAEVLVEQKVTPLGIDAPSPRISWIATSTLRGARQTAYQILVASDEANCRKGQGNLWDSGKVASVQNVLLPYGGSTLSPRTRYFVQVRLWDEQDKMFAATTWFETGLLNSDPSAWKAQWIGLRPANDNERRPFVGARWIAPAPLATTAATKRVGYTKRFDLPPSDKVVSADLYFVGPSRGRPWDEEADHRVTINETALRRFSSDLRDPRRLTVTSFLRPGGNQLWIDSPYFKDKAILVTLRLELADGRVRFIQSDRSWASRTIDKPSFPEEWRKDAPEMAPFVPSKELGMFGERIDAKDPSFAAIDQLVPVAQLRKSFSVAKAVTKARLYATAAGVYEMTVNGFAVGADLLSPGWTDYSKRVLYQTYDVTKLIHYGPNAVAALLADGWYAGRTGLGQHLWGFEKALRAELHISYADGTEDVIASDGSWRGSTGPIRSSDLLDGEQFDARLDNPLWNTAGFDDRTWRAVFVPSINIPHIDAATAPAVKETQVVRARNVTTPEPGVQIFDLGQNMVGSIRMRFTAPRGSKITVRYAEILDKSGKLFTDSLRSARVLDEYVSAGRIQEVLQPKFTFHGFRYVEVRGLTKPLPISSIVGLVWHSDLPRTGSFQTSNAKLNQLQSNIVWGQRGNFLSIPTDCPARDERLGWTGDIQLFAPTATFNMDSDAFIANYLVALQDGQRADGAVPFVAPTTTELGYGSFGWGDAIVLLPTLLYDVYGDLEPAKRQYNAMKKWVDFRTSEAKGFLNEKWGFGDWVAPPPGTPNKVIGPMFHARVAKLVANTAELLGKPDDARTYNTLFDNIVQAINKAHVSDDGHITSDTQTSYVIALRYDILPVEKRALAVKHLLAAIARSNGHLNTGFLGTGHLLPALSMVGHDEAAYKLLLTETYPSWLYTVNNGATTMWERWNGYSPEEGPRDVGGMNSYNHYAFGAVGEWMYETLAGIKRAPKSPGFASFVIRPRPGGDLKFVRARYHSVRGDIGSAWSKTGKTFTMDVEVPVHASAKVHVPCTSVESVFEGVRPATKAPGVKFVEMRDGAAVFEVASGTYQFVVTP